MASAETLLRPEGVSIPSLRQDLLLDPDAVVRSPPPIRYTTLVNGLLYVSRYGFWGTLVRQT